MAMVANGVEISNELTWLGWKPGGEYTKQLTIKNLASDKQRVDFSIPKNRAFGTLIYPQPVTLNPGTSYSMPIIFKPLENKIYEDKIECKFKSGKVEVPIKGLLPEANIEIPQHLNFGYAAVLDTLKINFQITNTSTLKLDYSWTVPEVFAISPLTGSLEGGASSNVEISFSPKSSAVFEGYATLKYGEHWKSIKLEGFGKYPHIVVKNPQEQQPQTEYSYLLHDTEISFGAVQVDSTAHKIIEIHNVTSVNATYLVEQMQSGRSVDNAFSCINSKGVVPAQSKVDVKFAYKPQFAGSTQIDYFTVTTAGQLSRTVIKCSGSGRGPSVEVSCKSVQFGTLKLGESRKLSFHLTNTSPSPANYQFNSALIGSDTVFSVSPHSGVVKRGSPVVVTVTFCPTHSINYFKRLQILLTHHAPLDVHLLGTCHDLDFKPHALTAAHIDSHYNSLKNGLGLLSPEHLQRMLTAGTLVGDGQSLDWAPGIERPEDCFPIETSQGLDGLFDEQQDQPFVTLEPSLFDFGRVTSFGEPFQQTLNITNNARGKVTIVWTSKQNSDSGFWIEPRTADIPPLKAQSFRVNFKPDGFDKFFGTQLEGFAFFKVMRDHKLITDVRCVTLPWCINVQTLGHTFSSTKDTFKAQLETSSRKLTIPPVSTSTPAFLSLNLTNVAETSAVFNFDQPDPSTGFQIWPQKGLIAPSETQVAVMKFTGDQIQKYKTDLKCHVNHNPKYLKTFKLSAFVDAPQLLLDSESTVCMKPTTPGSEVSRKFSFRNCSRLQLEFEWKISKADSEFLRVKPMRGTIAPNEIQAHDFIVTPASNQVYHLKPLLKVSSKQSRLTKSYKVQVVSETTEGSLRCIEEAVDFGEVVCGSKLSRSFTIYNDSSVDVSFSLNYSQQTSGPYEDEETQNDKPALELSPLSGVLPARTHQLIKATVCPQRRVHYLFTVFRSLQHKKDDEPQVLCELTAQGMFPCVQVRDAQSFGAADNISKVYLWRLLNIDRLNAVLDADPEESELRFSAVSRMSAEKSSRLPSANHSTVQFNFGAAPENSKPTSVTLLFENTSHVTTEWNFYFPSDLQMELEYWAETGDYTEEELHQLLVTENRLFTISPKCGKLEPGESVGITFTYKHIFPGTNQIPVLLKLNRGREIVLKFVGVTVELERKYLHFPSPVHQFRSVPIASGAGGEGVQPPQQLYELYNGGALPLKASLDLSALEECKQENYDCAIFECLDKDVYLEPGSMCAIRWIFRPIEAKLYSVQVPINIHGGETAVVTFEGLGYDTRQVGSDVDNVEDSTENIPTTQAIGKPNQSVFLSEERLSLGDLPLFTRGRRVVCLTNTSFSDTVRFKWLPNSDPHSASVSISPPEGVLPPCESVMFRVVFTAAGFPSFYNLDFKLEIQNATLLARYESGVAAWEEAKARQQQEFTITEANADRAHLAGQDPSMNSTKLKYTSPPHTPKENDFKHYETLPPIKKTRGDKDHRKTNRAPKPKVTESGHEVWEKPTPPQPSILHLGITARTHNVQQFEEQFHSTSTFFVDRTLSRDYVTDMEKLQTVPEHMECISSEYDLATGIFTSLLKSMFEDATFHDAVKGIKQEPVPYFAQLRVNPRPEPAEEQVSETIKKESTRIQLLETERSNSETILEESRINSPELADREQTDFTTAFVNHPESTTEDLDKSKSAKSRKSVVINSGRSRQSGNTESREASQVGSASQKSMLSRSSRALAEAPNTAQLRSMEQLNDVMEILRGDAEASFAVDNILENALSNIISEAVKQNFNPTQKPRLIAESTNP